MNEEKRAKLDKQIETWRDLETKCRTMRQTLETIRACGDITALATTLKEVGEAMKREQANVTDINEARKATKQ